MSMKYQRTWFRFTTVITENDNWSCTRNTSVLSEAPKVSWEDEEEPESKEVKQDVEKSLPTKPKQVSWSLSASEDNESWDVHLKAKKNKLKELREKQKQDIEQTKMLLQAQTLATPEEQKAHVQKLVENADFDSAADIFGADFIRKDRDLEQVTRDEKSSNKTEKTDIEATISKMRLATEADAERLGNVVASKLIASPVQYMYSLGSKLGLTALFV